LARLRPGTLLVNASRGDVIENIGLLEQLKTRKLHAALDVWPDEPFINLDLLAAVSVATPHVAGYSREGKLAGTRMIFDGFCKAFSVAAGNHTANDMKTVTLDYSRNNSPDEILRLSIQASSQVSLDDTALRNLASAQTDGQKIQIDNLRATYPQRYEFKTHTVIGVTDSVARRLRQLGFKTG
jgi:erythronate-4-phosphate dehydrogenase